jgi:hypothetical protein
MNNKELKVFGSPIRIWDEAKRTFKHGNLVKDVEVLDMNTLYKVEFGGGDTGWWKGYDIELLSNK